MLKRIWNHIDNEYFLLKRVEQTEHVGEPIGVAVYISPATTHSALVHMLSPPELCCCCCCPAKVEVVVVRQVVKGVVS